MWTSSDLDWMSERKRRRGLQSLIMVERQREQGSERSTERTYYLSSAPLDAAQADERVRRHWAIENGLHWALDVVFDEDR